MTQPQNVKHAGYFFGLGVYGDYLDKIAQYTNWVHVSNLSPTEAANLPERAKALEMKISFNAMQIFYLPGAPYTLRADWLSRWQNDPHGRPLALRLAAKGVLHSVYVADEPYGNGISKTNVELILATVGAEFPTLIIEDSRWIVGSPTGPAPSYTAYAVPVGVTYYGFTVYTPLTFTDVTNAYTFLATVFPNNIIYLMQAFQPFGTALPSQSGLYNIGFNIPGVVGIAWFAYPNFNDGIAYSGAVSDHLALLDHVAEGLSITGKVMNAL